MKKILFCAVVIGVGLYLWKTGYFEPAPAKVYRSYIATEMERRGFSTEMTASAKWKLKVNKCMVNGNEAELLVTIKSSRIPPNAASFAFATITTSKRKVGLTKKDETWKVVSQRVIDEETSTYEDRKNKA